MREKEEGTQSPLQYNFGSLSSQWNELLRPGGWLSVESAEITDQAWALWLNWQCWAEDLLTQFGNLGELRASAPTEVQETLAQMRTLRAKLELPPGGNSQSVDVEFFSGKAAKGVYFEIHLPTKGVGTRKRGIETLTFILEPQIDHVREIRVDHICWGSSRLIQTTIQTTVLDPGLLLVNQAARNNTYCPGEKGLGDRLVQETELKIKLANIKGRCRFEPSVPCDYGGPLDEIGFSTEELLDAPRRILVLKPAFELKNRSMVTTRISEIC